MPRTRAFLASSLDGFIAGPDDDLTWLPAPKPGEDLGFDALIASSGAMLMGRRTYDIVRGFHDAWPYGDLPILVATTRPLHPHRPSVRSVTGTLRELIALGHTVAGDADLYVDGGQMVRSCLTEGLLDELVITIIPVVLGGGIPLFSTPGPRVDLRCTDVRKFGDLVQVHYRV